MHSGIKKATSTSTSMQSAQRSIPAATIFSVDRWTRRHSQPLTTDRGPVSHFRRDRGTERAARWNWQ